MVVLSLVLLLASGSLVAYAQTGGDYDLTWWTIDGGGKTGVSGGAYLLLSTAGQPDGAEDVRGGAYRLRSGFWPAGIPIDNLYLPLVLKAGQPDLVGSFSLNPPGPAFTAGQPVTVNVVVTNQGSGPAGAFWVDFYINPSAPPVVNQRWNDLCGMSPCYGMAWYVADGLGPGQSIALSSNDFADDFSRWPGYFASGTSILYLYVDVWNPTVSTGGVLESDETNNRTSQGGLSVTGLAGAAGEPARDIPPRPAP